jgi:NAD(P)-dependent dehydrogenase (short-subunit alcohol dehydrogenase family)
MEASAGRWHPMPDFPRSGVPKLTGRAALVTGGSRGIGRAIALRLAADGASVAVHYRQDAAAALKTRDEIRELGGDAEVFQAAFDAQAEIEALVESAESRFGPLSILVSNAGLLSKGRSVLKTPVSEVTQLLNVHMLGPFRMCQLALPGMRTCERGDIVFISSHGTSQFRPGAGAYNVAKAAAEALARTLANEERRHGIRVNVVAPGLVATDMGDRLARARGVASAADLDAEFPFGRVCRPEDVAGVVGFLVSADGYYVSGTRIPVDAGDI